MGDAEIIVAGGQESMSLAPHCQQLRAPAKMGPITLVDTMMIDGLVDAFGADTSAEALSRPLHWS